MANVKDLVRENAGVELNSDQAVWTLRYLAAITDPDIDALLRYKGRVFKEWRGPGRKVTFRWADALVAGMPINQLSDFRDYVFELLAEAIPPCAR